MNFNFGTTYYVVDKYKNVKRYVVIATQGDFVLGVQFEETSKYTLLEFLNDLCKDTKEDGYAGIGIHHKDKCFNTYAEADKSDKAREDFIHDVYNILDFLPTNNEVNRIIDSFDRVTNEYKVESEET